MSLDLYLITPPEADFLPELGSVLQAGVDILQYRRSGLTDRERHRELRTIKDVTDRLEVPLIVNDRLDLALAVEAAGVHLGDEDLPVIPVKTRWQELIVGRTQRAHKSPVHEADYLSVGPVFESTTKNVPEESVGWAGVKKILDRTDRPVYAIGGITPGRLEEAPPELTGVALIGAVWDQSDPTRAVERLVASYL